MANKPGASEKRGFCVECRTECDCDVNQYCGASTDLVIPVGVQSSNTGSGITGYAREIMAAYGQAFSGMKLRGKCTSLPKVCVSGQKCISFCACRSSPSQYCLGVRVYVNINLCIDKHNNACRQMFKILECTSPITLLILHLYIHMYIYRCTHPHTHTCAHTCKYMAYR